MKALSKKSYETAGCIIECICNLFDDCYDCPLSHEDGPYLRRDCEGWFRDNAAYTTATDVAFVANDLAKEPALIIQRILKPLKEIVEAESLLDTNE